MCDAEYYPTLLYDKTCLATSVNEARKYLFTRKGRSIECIPPSSADLLGHTKRVAYQTGFIMFVLMPSRSISFIYGHIGSKTWHPSLSLQDCAVLTQKVKTSNELYLFNFISDLLMRYANGLYNSMMLQFLIHVV